MWFQILIEEEEVPAEPKQKKPDRNTDSVREEMGLRQYHI